VDGGKITVGQAPLERFLPELTTSAGAAAGQMS
jgi:hypothetical protein